MNSQPWEAPPPPLPPQTGRSEPVAEALVVRERGRSDALVEARSSSDAIIDASVAQREREREAQRERERLDRERAEREARERAEREQRDAEMRERIDALAAATSEVTSDAVLRLVGWGVSTLAVGVALHWLTSESRSPRPTTRRSRRHHQELHS